MKTLVQRAEAVVLDLEELRRWIGRSSTVTDVITPRLAKSFACVLAEGDATGAEDEAALGIHWCLAPPAVPQNAMLDDGHVTAEAGGVLPPPPFPRRMWAGGEIVFHDALQVGDVVERVSRITDITAKEGRSGALCFVTLLHEYSTRRGLALRDRQDLVYRKKALGPAGAARDAAGSDGVAIRRVDPDAVLLFRYSALTFNAHRIHYDAPYARNVEGYPGLVVHGPLQATLLLQAAARHAGRPPRRFTYRATSALFAGTPFDLMLGVDADSMALWTQATDGRIGMRAAAQWDDGR